MGKESANIFALSAIPQANYTTPLVGATAPKNFRQVEKTDRTLANYSTGAADNRGYSTGTPYPTRRTLETHDVTTSFTEDLSSQLLGERAYAGFGSIQTEDEEPGEAWKHTFEMLNPQVSDQLPAYGYVEKTAESGSRPSAHDVRFDSLVCGNFAVQGQGRSIVQGTTQWNGSGKRTAPSGVTFFGGGSEVILLEDMIQNYFRNTAASLNLYPQKELGGSVHAFNCNFRDFNFSVNWNLLLEAGYLGCAQYQDAANPESGSVRGACKVGDPTVQFNFTALMEDGYDATLFNMLKTMQSVSAQLDYEGSVITGIVKHKASFILNAANIISVEHTAVDGENALRITTEPLALGQIMPVSLELINNVSSYAVPNLWDGSESSSS